ncbi:MAG: hypothetical protein ACR2RE_28165 [Geminicoccaceae bacterium]
MTYIVYLLTLDGPPMAGVTYRSNEASDRLVLSECKMIVPGTWDDDEEGEK